VWTRFWVSFLQIENLEFVFWLDSTLAWNGLILMSFLVYSKQSCKCW
jgi:hypothetical protein